MEKRIQKITSTLVALFEPAVALRPDHVSITQWLASIRRPLGVALLFVMALAIRLFYINQPPLDFHAVRQYHSLIIARSVYYDTMSQETLSVVPQWKKEIASLNRQQRGMWEPPIMEGLAALGYHFADGEFIWIPKILTSLFWCLGGVFIYLIARRINDRSSASAVFSTIFYLFLPFGVSVSRSFQPESLMMLGLVASIYVMLLYYESPCSPRLFLVATVWALAFLIKGISIFPVIISFLFIGVSMTEHHRILVQPRSLLLLTIALLPTILFYGYTIFLSKSLLGTATGNILPRLLLSPSFWKDWVEQIGNVIGYTTLIAALLGTLLLRDGLPRRLLVGLWCGYIAFGLVFSYTVHTHDYWNLQIVPIVALALGPLAALILQYILGMNPSWLWRGMLTGILLFAALILFVLARPKPIPAVLEHKVQVAQEIGALVDHSNRTIFLSSDYGLPLEYHGELSGAAWPTASDLEWEKLAGVKTLNAEDYYRIKFRDASPEFFIVLDQSELDAQPDLKDFLTKNFRVFAASDNYLIFDLTK